MVEMVYPLARRDPEPANRNSPTGFETQKELDPDFVALNSENRRYHFPLRFYIPVRATFAQQDPLLVVLEGWRGLRYGYVQANPVFFVDSKGLKIDLTDEVSGILGKMKEGKQDCPCGSATLRLWLDGDGTPGPTGKDPDIKAGNPRPGVFGGVGAWTFFRWDAKDDPCCCRNVKWKQFLWDGTADLGQRGRDSDNEGFMITSGDPPYNTALDHPHKEEGYVPGMEIQVVRDYSRDLTTLAVCTDPGPMYGKWVYKVWWRFKQTSAWGWLKANVKAEMHGDCWPPAPPPPPSRVPWGFGWPPVI